MSARRRRYGDQRACVRCGADIEWHGSRPENGQPLGWLDRGGGRHCLPYRDRHGELVTPRGLHKGPRASDED